MRKLVVTTKQGQSIRGTKSFYLWKLVLIDAETLDPPAELQGRVEIPRSNVAVVQVVA